MTGAHEKEFVNWYATSEEDAARNIMFAQNLAVPKGCEVTFTHVSADVIIESRGTYDLENGERVFLSYQSGLQMHGYKVVRGKIKTNQCAAYYLNGEPTNCKGPRVTGRSRTPAE